MTDKTSTQLNGFSRSGRQFLLLSLLSLLPLLGWGQTTVFKFSFENTLSVTTNNSAGTPTFAATGVNTQSYFAGQVGQSISHADWQTGDNYRFTVNTTGYTGLTFQFYARASNVNINNFIVRASTSTSGPWTTIVSSFGLSTTFALKSGTLPAAFDNQAVVYIELYKTDNAGAGTTNIRFDEAELTGTASGSGPYVVISSTGPAAANVAPGATDVLLYALNLNVTNGPTTLEGLTLTTAGTYQVADLQNNFRLYYSTDATYGVGDVLLGTVALAGNNSVIDFGLLSQSLATGSGNYLLLLADVSATPTTGRTVGIAATPNTGVTFASGSTKSGSGSAGGLQTIVVPAPEINVKQNTTSIASAGTYAFASTGLGSTTDVVFTIENLGTANLTLGAATVTGPYSLQSNYTSPVAASGNTTFTIRFTPAAIGANGGSVSIPNNDSDENPYVITFSGTGTPSTQSDIIANASFTYSSNIDYTQYNVATITNSSHSVGVLGFTVRDGGAAADADALPTILSSITFNVAGISNILSAALFNGNTMVANAPVINSGAGTIAFSGLSGANVTAADNGQVTLNLRVTFKQTAGGVTDNEQLTFTIAAANVTAAGSNTSSLFNPAFASVVSSTTTDRNRLEVTATSLAFGTQPSDGDPAVNLAAFTVRAVDANGNQDLDLNSCQVGLTSSGTGFSSSSPYTFSSGLITVSDAQFATSLNGVTITATAQSCLSNATATSNAFNIVAIPGAVSGDYRSTANGNINTAGIWQQYNGTSWVNIAGAPPTGTTNKIYIRHAIGSAGSNSRASLVVISGGLYTNTASSSFSALLEVRDGGVFQADGSFTIGASGTFRVENGGTVNINTTIASPSSSIWAGTEYFEPNSTFRFQNWTSTVTIVNSSSVVTSNTFNGYSAMFGNISMDFGSNDVDGIDILASAVSGNLTHENLTFTSGLTGNSMSIGGTNVGLGGNLVIASTFQRIVNMRTSGTLVLTVNGNYVQASGIVRPLAGSSGSVTLNINGNMSITGGTFDMNSTSASGATTIVNLKGNLTVAAPGVLQNGNVNGATAAIPVVLFNFSGTTPQLVTVGPTVNNLPIRILSGATVQLGTHLNVGSSASYATIVRTGGTFDFNGFNFTGAGSFIQEAGATLKITSPQGIELTGTTGNVQSTASGRNFSNAGIYHYTATTAQVTGLGLNPAAGHKVIIIDNPTSVTLSQSVGFSSTASATPGGIDIRQGIFQGSAGAFATVSSSTNDIYLTMAAGTTYRLAALTASLPAGNQNLPQAGGTYTLAPTSVIELIGTGDQILRGSKPYGSITFGGSGTKTLSSNVSTVTGTVTIQGAATIVDVQTNALGGSTTNFTMTDGRFRTARTTDTQPNMDGVYNLTGGVVEFYGTTAATTQTIRGAKTYFNVEIGADAANTASHNVLHGNGNVTVGGEFRIKSPAVYQIGSTNFIVGTTAVAGTFVMESGSALKYGDANGITLQSCGTGASCGAIRTPVRAFPSDASYGFINSSAMVTGNGLPASIVNLYLQKSTAATTVTLTNPLTVTGTAALTTGTFIIGNNLLTLSGTATGTGNGTLSGSATSNIVINGTGNLGTLYFTTGARQLQNLTLNKTTGSATFGTDLAIEGTLTLTEGTLHIGPATVLTLNGNLSRTSGAFGGTTLSSLVLNGSGALGGSLVFDAAAPFLQQLTLNRSGSKVVLGSLLNIAGNVDFTAGLLQTATGNELVFLENATQTGAGMLSHIVGPAIKVGNDAFVFPLGTDTLYAPIGISAPAGTTERFRADYAFADPHAFSTMVTAPLTHISGREYWQLNRVAGTSNVQVTLSWSNGRSGGVDDMAGLVVARYANPDWISEGNTGTTGSNALGTVTSAAVSGYGFFTLGSANPAANPLPVELISFTGAWKNSVVELNWATATEFNAAYFVVERSLNASEYTAIGQVQATGNTQNVTRYRFDDKSPVLQLAYYRLKQVDLDGTFRNLGPVAVRASRAAQGGVSVYPNPVAGSANVQFELNADESVTVRVLDMAGAVHVQQRLSGRAGINNQSLDLSRLAKGTYLLEMLSANGRSTFKLIKD